MTSISNLTATPASALMQRSPVTRRLAMDDQVYDPVLDPALNPALRAQSAPVEEITVTAKNSNDESFSFWDVLDLINPLQHIPGVNTIYRELTGDTIKTPVQLIGATVLGGPIGFAAAMVDSMIEESTGTDIGGHAMAMIKGEPAPQTAPEAQTMLAAAHSQTSAAQTQVAQAHVAGAAREFIPDDIQVAASSEPSKEITVASASTAPARMRTPTPAASAAALRPAAPAQSQQPTGQTPTEAEAFVQTAQIAAQANVFPTFKRTGAAAAAAANAQAQDAVMAANAAAAASQMRFMPLARATAERPMSGATRRDGGATSTAELKARTKFATGPVAAGRPQLAPATLAVATAAQNKAAPATAQEAYDYGRSATSGTAPAEMPVWFDSAMLGAIDKYKAMQEVR